MWKKNQPSLPRWIEDAYQPIERYLLENSEQKSVTRQQATQLIGESNPDLVSSDIDHALDYLLNNGWLYKVDDRLFVTEFHESNSE
jgi:DNA polymerase III alpha subunit (gram-positive type)